MAIPPHQKLIHQSASRHLKPIGLSQKGRSRTWLDDHGWWIIVVEFQPSSWSKGSHLNVGAMWLWYEKDFFSFDEGYRCAEMETFKSEEQFAPLADKLAAQAAERVQTIRQQFRDVCAVATHYRNVTSPSRWHHLNAAISCGLAGSMLEAKRHLNNLVNERSEHDWHFDLQRFAISLLVVVDDQDDFRKRIKDTIQKTRGLLKLPSIQSVEFDHHSKATS